MAQVPSLNRATKKSSKATSCNKINPLKSDIFQKQSQVAFKQAYLNGPSFEDISKLIDEGPEISKVLKKVVKRLDEKLPDFIKTEVEFKSNYDRTVCVKHAIIPTPQALNYILENKDKLGLHKEVIEITKNYEQLCAFDPRVKTFFNTPQFSYSGKLNLTDYSDGAIKLLAYSRKVDVDSIIKSHNNSYAKYVAKS